MWCHGNWVENRKICLLLLNGQRSRRVRFEAGIISWVIHRDLLAWWFQKKKKRERQNNIFQEIVREGLHKRKKKAGSRNKER